MHRKGVLVGLVFTVACGNSNPGTIDAANSADATDAPVALRTVTGVLNFRRVTTTGDVVAPVDLTGLTVSAVVPPTFTSYPGTTSADGTFSIPNVPVGTYDLKLGNRYIELSNDSVDLSYDVLGRSGVVRATSTTNLTFDVTNLAAWQATDEIEMFSPGNGTAAFAMETGATSGAPTAGATSLAGFVFDLSHADVPALIDGAAGDVLTLTQLATQTDGTRTYRSVARSFTPGAFSVPNGGSTNLTGTFSTVPAASPLDAVWDRPQFDAELTARSPRTTTNNWSTFAVNALPEAATRGFYHTSGDIVVFAPGYLTDTTPVNAAWSYGDPYPTEWTRIAWVRFFTYRFIQLGSASPVAVFARLLVYRDLATVTAQSPIVPMVGAVVSPKVNGMDAFGPLTGIGSSPTLSWTAPTIGVAGRYYVTVSQVMAVNGATTLRTLAGVETSATQVVIPSGILTAGNTYVFDIQSRSGANLDLAATPNALSLPDARASVTTAMATP